MTRAKTYRDYNASADSLMKEFDSAWTKKRQNVTMTETDTRTARAHLAPGLKSKKSSVMTEIDRKPAR